MSRDVKARGLHIRKYIRSPCWAYLVLRPVLLSIDLLLDSPQLNGSDSFSFIGLSR